jgi:hypothetical protein
VRRDLGIGAPRLAVRAPLPRWTALAVLLAVVLVLAALWWWGFDFGPLTGAPNRRDLEARIATLEAEAARAKSESTELRTRNSELETELAMTRGTQEALTRQASELAAENAQVKEELAFLQKLFADTKGGGGVTITRLTAERDAPEQLRYALLVVRGGSGDDYKGSVVLQATVVPADPASAAVQTVTLPDDQPDAAGTLKLRFKYYQRVEGVLRLPTGARVTALTARVYEDGSTMPRATRTLSIP